MLQVVSKCLTYKSKMLFNKLSRHLLNSSIYSFKNFTKYVNLTSKRSNSYNIDLKIDNISLNKYIKKLQTEYEIYNKNNDLSNPNLIKLQPIINILKQRNETIENINNLSELLQEKDHDIRALANEEKIAFEEHIKSLDEDLKLALLPLDDDDNINGIVLEVNAGVGGQEAMLFAHEIFNMYCNYAKYKSWDYEIAEFLNTESGGIRHASALISGHNAFRYFKHEAGVHRVQRIPSTEKSSRIHTSTVSVNAVPQPDDIEVDIQAKDLKIETKRATGAGGQHVNTTDSAVRIVHLPTGIAIECQTNRSQIKNRQIALQRLRAKLYEQQLDAQLAKVVATKKSQVRTNFRNEKIRTYNFSQDRISDHRLNSNVYNLKGFMIGGEPLDNLINKLDYNFKIERLKEIVNGSE